MKLLNAILIFAVSALICYSCGSKSNENSNDKALPDSEITDTSTIVSSDVNAEDSEKKNIINANNEATTSYKVYDNIYVLNGRVKSMTIVRYPAILVNGFIVADTMYNLSHHEIRFDKNGKVTLNTFNIASGGGYASFVDKDAEGNPTKIEYYDFSEQNVTMIAFLKYDHKFRLIKNTHYFNNPFELARYTVINYDDSNNSMITKHYEANHKINFKTHEYLDSIGNIISKTEFTYNDDTISFSSHQIFSYVYDKFNNWTVQYENGGDGEYAVTYRIFTYYE
jgi:hypothetical protein